jgi:membrane-bound metal-dependent hydrolase YbcI (DUF457 family)
MDTITHGIVGALAGKALFSGRDAPAGSVEGNLSHAMSWHSPRAAIVACTLGALFPDIDMVAGPLARNPLAIMEWHRNITHSAVMLPAWSFILAALSAPLARWIRWNAPPFWTLSGIYAVGIATHIFLDLVTSFGTMVWSPLQNSRLAWDWVFILDLTLTAIALVPQLAAWCYRGPGQFRRRAIGIWIVLTLGAYGAYWLARLAGYGFSLQVVGVVSAIFAGIIFMPTIGGTGFQWSQAAWCRAGLAVLCAYISLAALAHRKALTDVKKFAAEQHLQAESLAALPMPPTLTHWVGLIGTRDGVWRTTLLEPDGAIQSTQLYSDAQSLQRIEEARKLPDVQVYLWFARYPIWRVRQREGQQTVIEISDVRFFRRGDPDVADEPESPRKVKTFRRTRAGFRFEVVFDAQGRVVSHGFTED